MIPDPEQKKQLASLLLLKKMDLSPDDGGMEFPVVLPSELSPLDELLPASGDAWLIVEAGAPLLLAGDLGGGIDDQPDGIPDTTDNNGDGRVDLADVTPGDTTGPLDTPKPTTDRNDVHFPFSQVIPGGVPAAFTNPFVFDRDGNGRFDAPGVGGGVR